MLGEVLPFNISPVPEILPAEEMMLTISNEDKERYENQREGEFEKDEFSYLDYENNYFETEENVHSERGNENEEGENVGQNKEVEKEWDIFLQNDNVMQNNMQSEVQIPEVGETEHVGKREDETLRAGNVYVESKEKVPEFLVESDIPSEQSFFVTQPEQSSPEKNIKVNQQSKVPKFLLADRQTRSSKSGKVLFEIDYKNPLRKIRSPFSKKTS